MGELIIKVDRDNRYEQGFTTITSPENIYVKVNNEFAKLFVTHNGESHELSPLYKAIIDFYYPDAI